jgi:thiol:disulfide interchange protein DsbD
VTRPLAGLLLLATPAAAQQQLANPHVVITLAAEVSRVTPGGPFGVAIRFQPDPGWHVYWRNPGASGIGTTVRWVLPAGFRSDSIAWPVPELYDIAGIRTHVLHGDMVLETRVTPPAAVRASPVRIEAEIRYGICQDVCVPGSARIRLDLAWSSVVGRPSSATNPDWRSVMGVAETRRPRTTGGPTVLAVLADSVIRLTIRPGAGQSVPDTVTFFATDRDVLPAAVSAPVRRGAAEAVLRLPLSATPAGPLRGVLVFGNPAARVPVGWPVAVPVRRER